MSDASASPAPVPAKVYELVAPRQLVVREQRVDMGAPRPAEIACETLFSAVSPGTELAAYIGLPPLRPGPAYPRLIGYCNLARVVAVGPDAAPCRVGDLVLTNQSHRSAFVCPAAEVIAVAAEGADLPEASVCYLFQLGYSALLRAEWRPGNSVAVIGAGALGLATVSLAASSGSFVACCTAQTARAETAGRLGARRVLTKHADAAEAAVRDETGGHGAEVVVTTSNLWEDWRLALRLARVGGTIAVLGFPGRGSPLPDFNPLDSQYFYDKQLRVVACGLAPDVKRNCSYLLDLITRGRLHADALVSEVVPWTALEDVYRRLERRDPSLVTAVLKWT